MQSPAELNTEPAPQPDQELKTQRIRPVLTSTRLPYALVIPLAAVALIIGLVLLHRPTGTSRKSAAHFRPELVENGTMRLKGTTEAVRMRAIMAPLLAGERAGTLTLTKLAPNGTRVKQGDLLAEFDRQAQMREYVDKQAEYDKLKNQVVEEQAKEAAARAKDETEIKQAENTLSKAELELQKRELLSQIDAEKAQQTLEEAQATLKQLRESFDLKRQAANAGIRLLEIQRNRAAQVMQHAQANAELMQIRSPLDGVVVLNTIWKQGRMAVVQEGDQMQSGVSFLQIVDPTLMQVRALANQQDFVSLQIDQPAKIRLDAYPELVFSGRLEEMAPVARNGNYSPKLRSFPVVFSISGNDARLMPDLSAAVDVELTTQDQTAGSF
jgi:HlyD family secretion protein